MIDRECVLVDTNIILDVFEDDPRWADWSQEQLIQLVGRIAVNPLIYSELCYEAGNRDEVDGMLVAFGLAFFELPREALFLASKAYKVYRQRGGTKTAPLPDFFIGAHAVALGITLLTRDAARYQSYFPEVKLITPDLPCTN